MINEDIAMLIEKQCIPEADENEIFDNTDPDMLKYVERSKKRKSKKYRGFLKEVKKRDGYKCRMCGASGCTLSVHHLDGYAWCCERRSDPTNGITLCLKCHTEYHKMFGGGDVCTRLTFKIYTIYRLAKGILRLAKRRTKKHTLI